MTFDAERHCKDLILLARQAGEVIMPYFHEGVEVRKKTDRSPVTLADQASEDLILTALARLTPDIPIVAEELAEDGLAPDVSDAEEFWLVDPLDGTKEFIKGSNDFTVNIGLIRNGVPVFGCVYLPALGDVYYGGEGLGAFRNDVAVHSRPYRATDGLVMVGKEPQPDKHKDAIRKQFLKDQTVASYTSRGSSLKFCLIADGTAHLYPRFVPTYEWDTAAAHALLLQTGGDIVHFDTGERLQYGKPNFLNGHLVTGTNEVLKILKP
jgi:3'(2'), 5'-bisphosphate nucleotidase